MAKAIKTVTTVVRAIDEPAPGVRRIELADPDGWTLPPFKPGAHIDLHLHNGLVRTYSLCNAPSDHSRYVVAIKREPVGRGGSQFIHDELQVGDVLGVSLPRGGLKTHDEAANVFVAGGIGVTPFVSAVRDMELRGQTNYVLHWASMGPPSLIDMLEPAVRAGRVRLYDTTQVSPPDIPTLLAEHPDASAFCCGPAPMLDAFEQATEGWPVDRKHLERFTAPKAVPSLTAKPFKVVLAKSQRQAMVSPEQGLLATLEAMDADVSVSCAGGICGACRTRYVAGQPIHRDRVLSPAEREHEVIVCVAECASDELVLDI